MNILIYGQKSFGLETMKALHEDGHKIVGAVVSPQASKKDKMVGFAQMNGIPIFGDCDKVRSDDIPIGVDLVVSAHSHWIISDAVLSRAKYGGIGYHPSLLPRHRGQDAVRWTIHMKDPICGGTVYRLTDKCDGGETLLQRWQFVDPSWDFHALWRVLFPQGVEMLRLAVSLIAGGKDAPLWRRQDERFATWEPSWERPRLKRNDLMQIEWKD